MKLSKDEVEKLAQLARIEVSGEEKEKFAGQLSDILDYAGKLNSAITEGVETTSQVTDQVNVFQEDESRDWPNKEGILENVPERDGNFFKVNSVLKK